MERYITQDALASLPRLEELKLDCDFVLGALHLPTTSNLRQLTFTWDDQQSANLLASLARLDRLQHLCIFCLKDNAALRALLRGVPPSLQTLELDTTELFSNFECDALLRFNSSRITAIEVPVGEVSLVTLASAVRKVLMPSGAVGPPLDRLFLDHASFPPFGLDEFNEPSYDAMRTLVRRCANVEIEHMDVSAATSPEAALDVLSLLGTNIGELRLQLDPNRDEEGIRVRLRSATRPAAPVAAAAAAQVDREAGEEQQSLVDTALERMVAAAAAGVSSSGRNRCSSEPCAESGGKGQGGGASGGEGGNGDVGPSGVRTWRLDALLLLRGALVESLLSDEAEEGMVSALVTRLEKDAKAATASGADAGQAERLLAGYIALPCAGVIILKCRSPAARAAVEAAARTATAAVAQEMAAAQEVAADLEQEEEEGELLRVEHGAVEMPWELPIEPDVIEAFAHVLSLAAQEAWECSAPGREAWSERERLQWLLEQWADAGEYMEFSRK